VSRTLVFGLSGQLGDALQDRIDAGMGTLLAISRGVQADRGAIRWQRGSLQEFGEAPADCERILSLGPLDAFADWVERTRPRAARIVAIGSTGVHDKRESPDPIDRDEAHRLARAEAGLFTFGAVNCTDVTVLRPTLLYGSGRDRSLTLLAQRARRWRGLPWPRSAIGRRSPVHVGDVAQAVLACLDAPASHGRAFDLPGGEVLAFDAMVARYLQRHAPGAKLLRLPDAAFQAALAAAGLAGKGGRAKGWLWRARRHQDPDVHPARQAFGYSPRRFEP
jgi:nucleoside-diphosphate-sugar epimerase